MQYVQIIKEIWYGTGKSNVPKEKENKEWCIDTSYPTRKLTHPFVPGPAASWQPVAWSLAVANATCPGPCCRISMEDSPVLPLEQGSVLTMIEAGLKHTFETYLMFRSSAQDSYKESLWVPLARVDWGWSVGAKRTIDWKENELCNESYAIFHQSPPSESGCSQNANPKHPEWGCNVIKNDH